MSERRWVIACGDLMERTVERAPESEAGDFLTKTEAARRVVAEMDGVIANAKRSRNRALRIVRAERKKAAPE